MIADWLRGGTTVCLSLSEYRPFDLVAVSPSMEELRRVQVRYAAAKQGGGEAGARRNPSERLAIFCPDPNEVYYVLRDEIPAGLRAHVVLRQVRSRTGQVKNMRSATDFVMHAGCSGP